MCSEASAIVDVGVVPGTEILLEVSTSVISFVDSQLLKKLLIWLLILQV